jgi:hypothetical protein
MRTDGLAAPGEAMKIPRNHSCDKNGKSTTSRQSLIGQAPKSVKMCIQET